MRLLRLATLLLPFGFFLAGAATGCQSSNKSAATTTGNGSACSGAQALTAARFHGDDMPAKTIALTFDDGPGPRTLELSAWLKNEGVRAAFFVNGKMLGGSTAALAKLVADGHVIGNHTETHPNLTSLDATSVVAEVTATDALIAPFVPDQRFMFRPPFGAYDNATFAALEASPMKKYIGPIDWEIGNGMGSASAADWDCWQPAGTSDPPVLDVKTCGDLYLAEIRAKDHGIVLLHDPYFIDDDVTKGGTVDMVMYIVPLLKAEGFSFVTVDEVPSVAAALPPMKQGNPPNALHDASAPAPAPAPAAPSAPPATSSEPPATTTTEDPCATRVESGHLGR